jgi:hypothetical protein
MAFLANSRVLLVSVQLDTAGDAVHIITVCEFPAMEL